MPTALFVGDNRDGANWGGRAQSIALMELIGRRFAIPDTVAGAIVTGSGPFVKTALPSAIANAVFYRRKRTVWFGLLARMQELLGAHDFVTADPGESADTILRYSRRFDVFAALRRGVEQADVVVVNGEGSGIFSTPFRRDFFFYLALTELSVRLGKPVYFVNTIFSDCPITGRNRESVAVAEQVLARCADVHVRDPWSLKYAAEFMPRVNCRYIPDALFTWFDRVQHPEFRPPMIGDFVVGPPDEDPQWFGRLDFSRPYVCVGGSSLAAYEPERARPAFLHLVTRLADLGLPVYVVQACGGDRFLRDVANAANVGFVPPGCPIVMSTAILANARLLVSGRFHPTILASLGGTPTVFLEAHSHKMRSLQDALEYVDEPVFSTFPDATEVERIVERSRELLGAGGAGVTIRQRTLRAAHARSREAERTAEMIVPHQGRTARHPD